jgi:hypothetical protein
VSMITVRLAYHRQQKRAKERTAAKHETGQSLEFGIQRTSGQASDGR